MRISLFTAVFFCVTLLRAQVLPYSEGGKWGLRKEDQIVVPAVYDTVFGFDPTGKVCLACHRVVATTSTGFIRVKTTSYQCNYLNKKNARLVVQNMLGDTTSVFSLGRNAVKQYHHAGEIMTVSAGGKRHLVDKEFHQLTFKGYYNVEPVPGGDFYKCEYQSESDAIYTGIVTRDEKQMVPFSYSNISFNPADSLIIACTAGFKGTDDLFDYYGHKIFSTSRHLTHATRTLLVERHPELPRQYYVIDRLSGKEAALEADEVIVSEKNELRFRKKKNWYSYDLQTGKKEIIKQP